MEELNPNIFKFFKFFLGLRHCLVFAEGRPEILVFCVYGNLVNGFEGRLIGERLDFEWLKRW